jgi:hypothetical protein
MLLLVAILSSFLAYNVNWVRERREIIGTAGVAAGDCANQATGADAVAPGLLKFFGEGGYGRIVVFPASAGGQLTPSEQRTVDRVTRLFPEAKVESHWPR